MSTTKSKYKTAAEAIAAMQAREQASRQKLSTSAFMDACANMDHAALTNDPRTKAYDAKIARRERSLYRDGGR
jgi:hypothetical protein